mgnify:CR=1 FL=1|tara:strand:- start:484 stop:2364 length:1881 start_codon:yes stop_codon:yes gene_type:complete
MYIKVPVREAQHSKVLIAVFQGAVVLIFVILLGAFWNFQVGQYEKFLQMAENNHQRRLPLRAPRGVLFDRNDRVLVENRHSLNISLVRERVSDLDETLQRLSEVIAVDKFELWRVLERQQHEPLYRPVVLVPDATLSQVSAVSARSLELPGIVVEQSPARYYPTNHLAAHSFGYVGEVTTAQLSRDAFGETKIGDIVGQAGLEQIYNQLLMGVDGSRHVVVNSQGREIETIGEVKPVEGASLKLTIDYDLQLAAEEAFQLAGFDGAAVVLDPQSGEVLALVSLPAYDPNAFATGIDRDDWSTLNNNRLNPLQNRALRGRYSPGSTFKIAMAVAALEEGVIDPDFKVTCGGGGTFYGRFFRCHATHGTVALDEALEKSCNTYFYTLGEKLDVDQIHKWSTALGLGQISGVDLPYEVKGLVPSRVWKQEAVGERWYPGETISVSIGQGQVSVTPISLAVMMATVANDGLRVVPRLLHSYSDGNGWRLAKTNANPSRIKLSPKTLEVVKRGLWMVVNREGTGRRGQIIGRDVIGKTGTAQVISLSGREAAEGSARDLRDHGWFVFAAPRNNPQIAGVVFGEHAEHGYLAAPIARHVIETFFAKREGRELPTLPILSGVSSVPTSIGGNE